MTRAPDARRAGRSWPLLLLAGCAFIPGFGFFFGAAAVSWGLVSERRRARLATVLGAVGALLNLAGGAALVILEQDAPAFTQARAETARVDLTRLVGELERYHERHGAYPRALIELVGAPIPTRLVNINDQSGGILSGTRPYHYVPAADGQAYDLLAVGPDGTPYTGDDVRPVLADSVRERTGYRPRR